MPVTDREGPVDRLLARPLEEAVVLLFAVLSVFFILPFAVLRAVGGDWLHAAVDLGGALLAVGVGAYVWRTGRAELAARVLVTVFTGTLIAVVHLFDFSMLFWAYPVTTAVYFLVRPRAAVCVNGFVLLAVLPRVLTLGGWAEIAGFVAPLLANNVLALIFAAGMRRSRSDLRLMAERDALTGTGNRHALDPALKAALNQHLEQGTPISLIVLDIDHFKEVNDCYGHEVGDRVLTQVVEVIEASVRAGDRVFRYGGEELVVVASGAGVDPACRLADKIRRRIRRTPLAGVGHIAVSAGVAEVRPGDTPRSWFARADEAMYRAKEEGRDRVRCDVRASA